ncbi:S1C family serine protease, partial [Candidatus Puniceispirillum sp.]|nr:S1C family serine protease [Candidatus Puniceispirillum sp.]
NSYAEITKEKVERFYESIVSVRSIIPPEARTAASLGVKREGNGVAIDENHILTIGYIVIESESIEIGLSDGRRLPAKLVGYDHTSGFGIIKSVIPLSMPPLQLGNSDTINSEQDLLILPSPNRGAGSIVRSVSRRSFTGWWEYFVESPIYTTPPNRLWAGAPILNGNGEILGIGSLFVSESVPGIYSPGNMSVPINLLKPILGDLISSGRRKSKIRPYLGILSDDSNDQIIVTQLSKGGPASQAGIKPQDIIVTINGATISNLKSFYEEVWRSGEAGVIIELSVLRSGSLMNFKVKTVDRLDYFFKPQGF